ncbi:MAG TPA: hypothetical protein VGL40_05500 [Bacillota bacterium]
MRTLGLTVLAAIIAAMVALVANRVAVGDGRRTAVAVLVPLLEETAKTGSALFLTAPILATHALFGAIELVYDVAKPSKAGLFAGLVGLAGHLGFGTAAALVWRRTGSGPAAVLAATMVHVLFNSVVIGRLPELSGPSRRRKAP